MKDAQQFEQQKVKDLNHPQTQGYSYMELFND